MENNILLAPSHQSWPRPALDPDHPRLKEQRLKLVWRQRTSVENLKANEYMEKEKQWGIRATPSWAEKTDMFEKTYVLSSSSKNFNST